MRIRLNRGSTPAIGLAAPSYRRILARVSHRLTAKARDRCATTSLGSIAVLDGLSSTPPRADLRPPRIDAPLTHFRSPRGEKCGLVLLAFVIALFAGCTAQTEPTTPQDAFITRNGVELAADLAPSSPVVSTLDFGTPVKIVGSRRGFVRVQTLDGREGWALKSMLISPEMRRRVELLGEQTANFASQGRVHALDTLNVHVEPYRWSPTLYQLEKDESVEALRRQLVGRLPHEPDPNKPLPEPTGHDDWYLVRLKSGQPGWLLVGRTYSGIPIDVAQYAERRRIISYFPIGEVHDPEGGETKPTWLWTQVTRRNQPHDFDRLRVFQWENRRHAYATIKLETGFAGYLPVTIIPRLETDNGVGVGFSILVSKGEQQFVRTYVHVRNRVYRVSEEPAPEIPEPVRSDRSSGHPSRRRCSRSLKIFSTATD